MVHLRTEVVVLSLLLTLLLSVWEGGQLTCAHAELDRSEPTVNAVIPTVPAEVHIWFTEELFKRKGVNIIEVSGPDGAKVDQGDTQIDDDDRKHAFVSLKSGLTAGAYTVRWRNSSAEDGHEGSGEFSFTVDPAAGETKPQVTPSTIQPSATKVVTPESSATAASESGATPPSTPSGSGGLPCLSGLLLGGLVLVIQHRRGIS
ncbi:MAG: copper resistance protein CopC [Anaerolineae bacterium]